MARPRNEAAVAHDAYVGADKRWHIWLPTGMKNAKGKEIRWHYTSKVEGEKGQKIVEDKYRAGLKKLAQMKSDEQARLAAAAAAAALAPRMPKGKHTLHSWIRYWLEKIAIPSISYNAAKDYRWTVNTLILPFFDDVPLEDLEPRHIEEGLERIRQRGRPDQPNRAYRRLSTALKSAAARPKETGIWHSPMYAVKQPAVEELDVTPLTVTEVRAVLKVAAKQERNGARWIVALALGLRQGEVLALRWSDIDLHRGILWVRENVYRRKWLHGCDDPHACGERHHRYPCPKTGAKHERYHRSGCPKVARYCAENCTEHAARCEDRHGGVDEHGRRVDGGQVRKPPKSKSGKRPMKMPRQLIAELRRHRVIQLREKAEAQALGRWRGTVEVVFATRVGTLLNESDDWATWKAILLEALGHSRLRLHDARHTTATMYLQKKIDPRLVIAVMGWSGMTGEKMRERYSHVLPEMLDEAAEGIEELVWGTDTDVNATTGATTPPLHKRRDHWQARDLRGARGGTRTRTPFGSRF